MFKDRSRREWFILVCIVSAIMTGMLYFGLRPKGYRPANNLQWLDGGPGVVFDRFAIAYTDAMDFSSLQERGFSIVFAVRPEISGRTGFSIILVAHDGEDARQLLIGQWRNWIIAMNGDDYDASRKVKRIGVNLAETEETVLVVLASGAEGTTVYFDGQLKKSDSSLSLSWPNADGATRLVVGNSIYGRNPWRGELSGLAVFGYALDQERVGILFKKWQDAGKFDFSEEDGLKMLFPLLEGSGEAAYDRSGNGIHLEMPSRMQILRKEILALPRHPLTDKSGLTLDVVLNFFGFWPLGFFLSALLAGSRQFRKYSWHLTVLFCFAFSLSLEVVQAWLPSRNSHMLDLILNTLGGALGALLYAGPRRLAGPEARKLIAHSKRAHS